ncbi:24468_t:CDS:2, partial [Gigaspora rosea]
MFSFLLIFSYWSFADDDENSPKEILVLKNNYTNDVPKTDKKAYNSKLYHLKLTHRLSKRATKPQTLGIIYYENDVE